MSANLYPSPHIAFTSAENSDIAGSFLDINLDALKRNYRYLANRGKKADCAAVIKADAYGIGLEQAANALWQEGCRTFFVALPKEGARARKILPQATIYILNGLMSQQACGFYQQHELRPVLGSLDEVDLWQSHCATTQTDLPCAIHFDTGMNRLGLSLKSAHLLADRIKANALSFTPSLIMSHLACADTPLHPLNTQQLDKFRTIRALFPDIPASFANSAGIFLGPDYHFDLLRPGIALYGAQPVNDHPNPMNVVATLQARILSLRNVTKGDSISYGAAAVTNRDSRIATICVGYADGYIRAGGSTMQKDGAKVWVAGREAPIIGRVTMDLIMIDVTDIPASDIAPGTLVEMFGPHIAIDDVAAAAGTIGYELLTSLGMRSERRYHLDHETD